MRCDACKYWLKPDPEDSHLRRVFGECMRTPHIEDMGEWGYDEDNNYCWTAKMEYADRTATASDASGYAACLLTKAEHFCAMFQERPQ